MVITNSLRTFYILQFSRLFQCPTVSLFNFVAATNRGVENTRSQSQSFAKHAIVIILAKSARRSYQDHRRLNPRRRRYGARALSNNDTVRAPQRGQRKKRARAPPPPLWACTTNVFLFVSFLFAVNLTCANFHYYRKVVFGNKVNIGIPGATAEHVCLRKTLQVALYLQSYTCIHGGIYTIFAISFRRKIGFFLFYKI